MPKLSKKTVGTSKFIGIRIDRETADYYSSRANERGVSLSDFLRNMIVQGMISETALDIEQRMQSSIDQISKISNTAVKVEIPDSLLMSIYTSEFLLTAIVEARDIQQLYDAQDKAKIKVNKEKSKNG